MNTTHSAETSVPSMSAGPGPQPLVVGLDGTAFLRVDMHFLNASPVWQTQDDFACTLDPDQDATLGSIAID